MSVAEAVRSAVIAVLVAALVGGAARVIGLDGPHALAIGLGGLAIVLILLAQRSVVPSMDLLPQHPDPLAGGRPDLEQLAWSMVEHRTHIRGVVIARVATIAAQRLAEQRLDPQRSEDAAAIESLLGPAAWAVLRPDRDQPVAPRALDATLRALEGLPPPGAPALDRITHPDRRSRAD